MTLSLSFYLAAFGLDSLAALGLAYIAGHTFTPHAKILVGTLSIALGLAAIWILLAAAESLLGPLR